MRLLLPLLGLLGLLMMPVAASAGAAACLHHAGPGMPMAAATAALHHTEHATDHSCCDEDGAQTQHDSDACAKACAAMCVATAALPEAGLQALVPLGGPHVEGVPPTVFHAHAPPGLKRPPRTLA